MQVRFQSRRRPRRGGFTFVELLAVVIIIGILAALIVPQFFKQVDKTRVTSTKTNMKTLVGLISKYRLDTGQLPDSLTDLVEQPAGLEEGKWEGPYCKPDELKDSWGTPFEYVKEGTHNTPEGFEIISFGADKVQGGEGYAADLGSWGDDKPAGQ